MFADIAREVEADFGEAGIQAVRRGVQRFGERRGRTLPTAPR